MEELFNITLVRELKDMELFQANKVVLASYCITSIDIFYRNAEEN